MIPFTIAKCKTRAGYSAKLEKKQKLDLPRIKEEFDTILETSILLVVRVEGVEVIVHGYGELLFKECEDIVLMRKIAEKIYGVGIIPPHN